MERREIHGFGVLDDGDDECARAVLLLDVDRQAEVNALGNESMRLAFDRLTPRPG